MVGGVFFPAWADSPSPESLADFPADAIWKHPQHSNLVGCIESICELHIINYAGCWFHPSEKYESQLGWFFPIYGKNVPNHQPVMVC